MCFLQDGICSPEDVDTAMTDGLGLRYSLIGPFETMQLNANGMLYMGGLGGVPNKVIYGETNPLCTMFDRNKITLSNTIHAN